MHRTGIKRDPFIIDIEPNVTMANAMEWERRRAPTLSVPDRVPTEGGLAPAGAIPSTAPLDRLASFRRSWGGIARAAETKLRSPMDGVRIP